MKLNARMLIASFASLVVVALAVSKCFAVEQADPAKQAALMTKLVEYARSKIGQKVDLGQGGECTELVIDALAKSGGKPMEHTKNVVVKDKKVTKLDTYDWGIRYVTLGKVKPGQKPKLQLPKPGCIIQFEECYFSKDGYNWNFPHHTAIVESVSGNNVTLLHQNVDGDKKFSKVRRQTIDFSGKTSGWYWIYYPVPQ